MFKNEDDFKELVNQLNIDDKPNNLHRENLRRQMLSVFNETQQKSPLHTPLWQNIGRTIMKNPITKFAAAAVIITAALIGIHQFGGSIDGASVAWADVVKPILNARTASLDILIGSQENQAVIHDEVMGSRIRRTFSNVEHSDIIIDLEQQKLLTIDHINKKAVYIELSGLDSIQNYIELLRNTIIRLQNKPDFQVEELGLEEIKGRDYIVFVAESDEQTITVWADPETALPIRIEQKTPNMQIVCDNLQFDVMFDESRFSMEVPDDYVIQNAGGLDFKKSSEADFVESLRIWAEILEDGQFPESINLVENAVKIGLGLDRGLKRANLTEQQQGEIALRFGQGLVFLRFFKGQGQWHYAGKGVELGDGNTPIFWYQPKDSETWRVIYGDLGVEDVVPKDLPEPPPAAEEILEDIGYQQWSRAEFVGTQKDQWHIMALGDIVVHSHINLRKGPQDLTIMPIALPYLSGVLESATIDEQTVPYSQVGKGRYELELPLEQLVDGQTNIECVWTLSLDKLKKVDYGYRIMLQSLIPVISYKLTVVLEPDCGFEHTKDSSKRRIVPFSWNSDSPVMQFGSCGLLIRKLE